MNSTDRIISELELKAKVLQESLMPVMESLRLMRDLKIRESGESLNQQPSRAEPDSFAPRQAVVIRRRTSGSSNKRVVMKIFEDNPEKEFTPKEILSLMPVKPGITPLTAQRVVYKLLAMLGKEGFLLVRKVGQGKSAPAFYRLNPAHTPR